MLALPDLKYDYSHAIVTAARFGPRREVTLTIQTLEWTGSQGHYSPERQLRFGGIINFKEAQEFFAKHLQDPHPILELVWLKFDAAQNSKPHDLFIKLVCERIDDQFTIHCSNIQIS